MRPSKKLQELNIKIQDLVFALLGFNLALVQSFLSSVRPPFPPPPPVGIGSFILCHCTSEICHLYFDSIGAHSEEFALSLQRQLELFSGVRTVKTLRILRYEWSTFCTSEILTSH